MKKYTFEEDLKKRLKDPVFNANLAAQDLARYFKDGIKRGLRGKNLTAFVLRASGFLALCASSKII